MKSGRSLFLRFGLVLYVLRCTFFALYYPLGWEFFGFSISFSCIYVLFLMIMYYVFFLDMGDPYELSCRGL
jgi:hypothetical protein